jgi:hypothetical protein
LTERLDMRGILAVALATASVLGGIPSPLAAQDEMHMSDRMTPGPLGISPTRMGSGTSWLPDASPMHAAHRTAGSWRLMLHGVVFGVYDRQDGPRGADQVNSMNWAMGMASRSVSGGLLTIRGMFSAEPFTVGAGGYPLLLQSGESYRGLPVHDRQHPHDLFMEVAALYERPLSGALALSLYLAPVGEPALGPVAYPHRPSAAADPFAPLGHHWQDATHISFGVLTAGLFTRRFKVEASLFNGREPDEHRYGLDYRGRSLDSYSARVFFNPADQWSLSASYGFLKSPEEVRPTESQHRVSASVLHSRPIGSHGAWSSALVYGANRHSAENRFEHSLVGETTLDLDGRNTVFGRAGFVTKRAEDLAISTVPAARRFDIGELTAGYLREVGTVAGLAFGVGASGTINFIPEALKSTYGSRMPTGFGLFLRVRPAPMDMAGEKMPSMPGHRMDSEEPHIRH